ncbi:sugar transporter ERD6-like 5 isoform X2 [Diospyros lotus]|uniref:sugar transporter ERD6-like 5 isoform X2 n=1 Tax=Diospyros lotus TaxID=55363 RepID=UPI00224E65D4|nr:sugar transporter ERD6-like 5 isoform X2 [Diospyros lotus]
MESRSGLMEGSYEEEHPRTTSPLLRREGGGEDREAAAGSSSLTWLLVFSNFVVASGSFANGCANGYTSPAESGIRRDLGLSLAEYSIFGSISTIGGIAGAIISGKMADLIGRRGTMWTMQSFCILGWLAIIFAQGAWLLDLGRVSIGFGLGLYSFVTPVYITEITPKKVRGGCAAVNELSVAIGLSMMFFIGNLIPWRTLAAIGTIPSIIQLVGVFFIPESPRWLAKNGRQKDVESTLKRLRGKDVDVSQEAAEIIDYTETLQQIPESSFLEIFQRKYAHSLIVGVGLMLLIQLGGTTGVSAYTSSLFEAIGFSTSIGTSTIAIVQIPFAFFCVLLLDRIGRRPLIMVTAAGAALGSFLAGLAFLLQDFDQGKEVRVVLMVTGLVVYFSSYAMGLGPIPWIIMAEVFPMNIKGVAGSLTAVVSCMSSWVVSYAFNFVFEWSSAGVFFIFTAICSSIVVFGFKLMPETKGRSLEEIQASMVQLFK